MHCSNGHEAQPGDAFCQTCGVALMSSDQQAGASAPAEAGPAPQAHADGRAEAKRGLPGWAWALIGAGAVVVAAGGAFAALSATAPEPQDITVTMSLFNGLDPCDIGLGYIDIPGAAMTLTADGRVVGTSRLSTYGTDEVFYCEFTGRFVDVPTDAEFYTLTLGNSNRGDITNSRSDLEANGWGFELSLGSD